MEQEGISQISGRQKGLRAFKLISRELKGLQRNSKGLEGLGKGLRGISILDPSKGDFHKSQNSKKTRIGCRACWTWHFWKAVGQKRDSGHFYWSVPLCAFSSAVAQEDLVLHPHGFSLSLPVPTTLLHCPLTQQPVALPRLWALKGKGHRGEERVRTETDRMEVWLEKHLLLLMPPWASVPLQSSFVFPCPSKTYSSKGKLPTDSLICCP